MVADEGYQLIWHHFNQYQPHTALLTSRLHANEFASGAV